MKKILIVGAGIIDKPHAAGITVRSIFDGIDSDLIMGLVWGSTGTRMKATRIQIKKLSYSPLSLARIFDQPKLKQASHQIKKAETWSNLTEKTNYSHFGMCKTMIRNIRQWIALIPSKAKVSIKRDDIHAIRKFAPEVIYTVGESIASLRLAYTISVTLNIPIIIHFMDNWKNSIEWASNPLLRSYQRKLSGYCDLCYSRTTECIAIGDRMAEAYQKETGVRHTVIMNSIDTEKFFCPPREMDGKTHFVYAGGLHLGRDKALRIIGECIERLCIQKEKNADFTIYTAAENIDLFAKEFSHLKRTVFHSAVSHDQIHDVYFHSDVLVHVESSELNNNEFFKYSVSTKISEYLATGRPILFFGPRDIYLFDFLRSNELAYTVSSEEEVAQVIGKMIMGEANKFDQNARKYAQTNFELSVARERFYQVIERVHLPNAKI